MDMTPDGLPIVRVSFNKHPRLDGTGTHGYGYIWPFERTPEIGDVVNTDTGDEATVIGFGTDFDGPLRRLSVATPRNRLRDGW